MFTPANEHQIKGKKQNKTRKKWTITTIITTTNNNIIGKVLSICLFLLNHSDISNVHLYPFRQTDTQSVRAYEKKRIFSYTLFHRLPQVVLPIKVIKHQKIGVLVSKRTILTVNFYC